MPGEAPPVDGEGPPEGPASRDEDPPNDHAGTAAGWRRWVAAHGGELAIGLIGVLVGTALVWVVAPQQEVRSQRAVERDQRQRASQGPALTYTAAYRYFPEDSHAYVFPGKLPESMDSMLATQTIWDNIETIAREYDGQHLIYPRIRGLTGQETQMLTRIGVTLEGRRTDPVLIRSITARIVARHPPLSGTFFSIGAQGDGDIPQMMFDLDSADLAARMVGEDLMVGSRYD
ncbi:MAG: hypothetical protein ABIS86_09830, partial [Streptosporangiaceae bacterium]